MRRFGYIPDEPDERDRRYALSDAHVGGEPGDQGSCEHLFADEPLYQDGHASCVAQVIVQGIRAAHVRSGHANPPLASRLGIWYGGRKLLGTETENSGMRFRDGFSNLNLIGFCQERYWPHELTFGKNAAFRKQPATNAGQRMLDQAADKQQAVYRRLYELGEARVRRLKQCIDAGMPPQFGTAVSESFVHGDFDPEEPVVGPEGTIAGNHGMICGAYRGDAFRVRSSWGAWQLNGWCWMAASYVSLWQDIWLTEVAPWFVGEA